MNWKEYIKKRKYLWHNLWNSQAFLWRNQGKTSANSIRVVCPSTDSNRWSPKYKSQSLSHELNCSVCDWHKSITIKKHEILAYFIILLQYFGWRYYKTTLLANGTASGKVYSSRLHILSKGLLYYFSYLTGIYIHLL